MAINLRNMNVLPPSVPSTRGGLANSPSFGRDFEYDAWESAADEMRSSQSDLNNLAHDRKNPLSKLAKIASVLAGVGITAITTKVTLSKTSEVLAKSSKVASVRKSIVEYAGKTKAFIIENYANVKNSEMGQSIAKKINQLKAKINSTKIGAWAFKKADAFKKSQTVLSIKEFFTSAIKSILGCSKDNVTTAIGGVAGAGVLANEIVASSPQKRPLDEVYGGDD